MRIGLTGSMAAGKSTVSAILRGLGFYIVDADKTAHAALDFPEVIAELSTAFGRGILNASGRIERKALARAAFASDENTAALNSIVHPRVFEAMLNEAAEAETSGQRHIVFDVPLLFETGFERNCERVICVIADDETRFRRIMLRDGLTRYEAAARLARQMNQNEKAARSDAVIKNSGPLSELEGAVRAALNRIGILLEENEAAVFCEAELASYLPDDMDE